MKTMLSGSITTYMTIGGLPLRECFDGTSSKVGEALRFRSIRGRADGPAGGGVVWIEGS